MTQATLLLREHQGAYDALVDAMTAGKPLGDCIRAMESALALEGTELPAVKRGRERFEQGDAQGEYAVPESTSAVYQSVDIAVSEVQKQLNDKRELLKAVEAEEARLREKIKEIEAQTREESKPMVAGGGWDSGESKRFTEMMLSAARKRKAEAAAKIPGGASKEGDLLDRQVQEAARARMLAEVDLELREKVRSVVCMRACVCECVTVFVDVNAFFFHTEVL